MKPTALGARNLSASAIWTDMSTPSNLELQAVVALTTMATQRRWSCTRYTGRCRMRTPLPTGICAWWTKAARITSSPQPPSYPLRCPTAFGPPCRGHRSTQKQWHDCQTLLQEFGQPFANDALNSPAVNGTRRGMSFAALPFRTVKAQATPAHSSIGRRDAAASAALAQGGFQSCGRARQRCNPEAPDTRRPPPGEQAMHPTLQRALPRRSRFRRATGCGPIWMARADPLGSPHTFC